MGSATFVTLDSKGRVTLPEEVRSAMGVGPGDLLLLEKTSDGAFELIPATLVPKDQLWFYHPEMQARLRQAEAELREGRGTTTATPEEAKTFLNGLKGARNTGRDADA